MKFLLLEYIPFKTATSYAPNNFLPQRYAYHAFYSLIGAGNTARLSKPILSFAYTLNRRLQHLETRAGTRVGRARANRKLEGIPKVYGIFVCR